MPTEVIPIALVFVIACTIVLLTIVKGTFSYLRSKHERNDIGSSMTTSDLERMLRRVVEEAVAPLTDRLDVLEERLDHRESLLLEAAPPPILEGAEPMSSESVYQSRRQQTR